MFPTYWTQFLARHRLDRTMVEVPEESDLSGLGVDMAFLTPEQSKDEGENYWPGIAVAKDGYVPVGSCLIGSGDWYYIRTADGEGGPLYRIYHDAVSEEGYDTDNAIAVVLTDYRELLRYK